VVTLFEEPVLARTFGAGYDGYRARVPRWIPRWRARDGTPTPTEDR
jgi:protein-S-isoprenylcysteine O-methyltransferase Ste14